MISIRKLLEKIEIGELRKVRSVFFPAMAMQLITGFNIRKHKEDENINGNATISYLHEDLIEGKPHFEQVKYMLEKYTDRVRIQKIKHEVIRRYSSYNLEKGWRAQKYFLPNQIRVEEKNVDKLIGQDITIIGSGEQNELIIKCEKSDLEHILEQFRLYANKYEIIAKTGDFAINSKTGVFELNPYSTWDNVWEIPPTIVSCKSIDETEAYPRVTQIKFEGLSDNISLIIGDKWKVPMSNNEIIIPSFRDYLESKEFIPHSVNSHFFTNRIFFDWLNHTNWDKVKKTIELYKRLVITL